jgi:hypothetical protein
MSKVAMAACAIAAPLTWRLMCLISQAVRGFAIKKRLHLALRARSTVLPGRESKLSFAVSRSAKG